MILTDDLSSSGLLWALAFKDGRGRNVPESALATAGADWAWTHFALSDHRSRLFIERQQSLPEPVRVFLLGGSARIEIHVAEGWTYGALPDLEHEFDGRTAGVGRLYFALDGAHVVTARRHALHVIDGVRKEVEREAVAIAAPADAVALLVSRFIDATEARLIDLGGDLDSAEDLVLSERGDLDRLKLGPIRRELSRHHREFVALRSAFHRAGSQRHGAKAGSLAEHLPSLLQEIDDFDRDLAGLQDRARLLHDEIDSKLASAADRSLRALTILSTLLLPPTLIVGAFGMNVGGIPWASDKAGFWEGMALCAGVVALCYWALRQARVLR